MINSRNILFGYVDSTFIFLKSKSDGKWSDLRICKTKKDEKKKTKFRWKYNKN